MDTDTIWDAAVIGGGPAGMMAAGRAAERGLKVLLIERNASLGKKLLITGGGRCNVTNAESDQRVLLGRFKGADKFLFSPFSVFDNESAIKFFNGRGMETKLEAEGRVFPASNTARSVYQTLAEYMKEGGVEVLSGVSVTGFEVEDGGIAAVRAANGRTIHAKHFVLATGGKSRPETGSTGDGFKWLAEIGHTVRLPAPSLVPVRIADDWIKKLSGVSLPEAKITLFQDDQKQGASRGKILFTHFGLSGPGILNLSADIADLLAYGEVELSLDLAPDRDYSVLNDALQELFKTEDKKKLKNALSLLVPTALVPAVLELSNIDGDTPCHSVSRESRLALIQQMKDMRMHVSGLLGADKAIITSGGVALSEIDTKTMRSKLFGNLFIVGDLLDIDRPSGGYSLQLCWTTGYVAGNSAGGELEPMSK